MKPSKDALRIDEESPEARIALAAELLSDRDGVVVLGGSIALRPGPKEILCEVVEPAGTAHRCAEEYKVLIENAKRRLEASRLWAHLPPKRLRWVVVEDHAGGSQQVWPAF